MKFFSKLTAFLMALVLLLCAFPATAAEEEKPDAMADCIYFYNIGGNGAGSGDFILVSSQGRYGLIDTGHRKTDTIEDEDGTVYSCPQSRNLSCQISFKNGEDAMRYFTETLGITHLDFIIGTHAHSDHIGGVPEIAALTTTDENGDTFPLVDENTVYFYKNYHHINEVQDDLGTIRTRSEDYEDHTVTTGSWHNQAYAYHAVQAVEKQGGVTAELSHDVFVSNGVEPLADFSDVTAAVNAVSGLKDARYYRGKAANYYDDFLSFRMGNLTIRLYNLFCTETTLDDNVNSIVAAISDGNSKFVSLADINVENKTEQKLAKEIYEDIGTVDLLKVAHHGTVQGSNSREMLDYFRPKYAVATRSRDYAYGTNGRGSYSAAVMYAKKNFGTTFYEAGASEFALAASFTDEGFTFANLTGSGEAAALTSAQNCVATFIPVNGWSHWTVEWGSVTTEELYYFRGGEAIANWYEENGYYYYIDANAQYCYGWQYIDGKTYYLAPVATSAYPRGAMYTGWNNIGSTYYYFNSDGTLADGWTQIGDNWFYFTDGSHYLTEKWFKSGGKWYYFDFLGNMVTGWQKIGGKWYYMGTDGAMCTGWQKADGSWYYLGTDGVMTTGWQKIGSSWYYLNASGVMQTGWVKSGGKWYYFAASGKMQTGWQKIDAKWYYFDKNGAMQTGKVKIGGKEFTFTASGVWVK